MADSTKFNTYFAAANGYTGFRSYFNQIFLPEDYTRIYVLKGGPGTGKSSLMKKVDEYFKKTGLHREVILCSSDPSSYDGVIIESGNKRFAIIDGTAPHETDARIPGAIDEIINLGEAWDRDRLTKERDNIVEINKRKKSHYKNAYDFLKLAGEFATKSQTITESALCNCEELASSILSDLKSIKRGRKAKIKLISAFGKEGYSTLDASNFAAEKKILVIGKRGSKALFMEYINNVATRQGLEYTLFPSPLSHNVIEGIYFESADMLISTCIPSENKIDTSLLSCSSDKNELSDYHKKLHDDLTAKAKEEFEHASSAHFELEAIYTPTMDFDILNKIRSNVINHIEAQL